MLTLPGRVQFDCCWSCQAPITEDSAVVINSEYCLPCCQSCWQSLHTGDRLQLAREFWNGLQLATNAVTLRKIHLAMADLIDQTQQSADRQQQELGDQQYD